jgi:single-strand DNA-binding protein
MNNNNIVIVRGNLSDKPKLTEGKNGLRANFSVAQNERGKNEQGEYVDKHTNWFNVVSFGVLAERMAMLEKGERISVMGKIKIEKYTDKNGNNRESFSIIASFVEKSEILYSAKTSMALRATSDNLDAIKELNNESVSPSN